MNDLKPCPFCAGKAELKEYRGFYGYSEDSYAIKCTRCHAEIKMSIGYLNLREAVIQAWNRRENDDTTESNRNPGTLAGTGTMGTADHE